MDRSQFGVHGIPDITQTTQPDLHAPGPDPDLYHVTSDHADEITDIHQPFVPELSMPVNMPKNWDHIERLKLQRKKLQDKLMGKYLYAWKIKHEQTYKSAEQQQSVTEHETTETDGHSEMEEIDKQTCGNVREIYGNEHKENDESDTMDSEEQKDDDTDDDTDDDFKPLYIDDRYITDDEIDENEKIDNTKSESPQAVKEQLISNTQPRSKRKQLHPRMAYKRSVLEESFDLCELSASKISESLFGLIDSVELENKDLDNSQATLSEPAAENLEDVVVDRDKTTAYCSNSKAKGSPASPYVCKEVMDRAESDECQLIDKKCKADLSLAYASFDNLPLKMRHKIGKMKSVSSTNIKNFKENMFPLSKQEHFMSGSDNLSGINESMLPTNSGDFPSHTVNNPCKSSVDPKAVEAKPVEEDGDGYRETEDKRKVLKKVANKINKYEEILNEDPILISEDSDEVLEEVEKAAKTKTSKDVSQAAMALKRMMLKHKRKADASHDEAKNDGTKDFKKAFESLQEHYKLTTMMKESEQKSLKEKLKLLLLKKSLWESKAALKERKQKLVASLTQDQTSDSQMRQINVAKITCQDLLLKPFTETKNDLLSSPNSVSYVEKSYLLTSPNSGLHVEKQTLGSQMQGELHYSPSVVHPNNQCPENVKCSLSDKLCCEQKDIKGRNVENASPSLSILCPANMDTIYSPSLYLKPSTGLSQPNPSTAMSPRQVGRRIHMTEPVKHYVISSKSPVTHSVSCSQALKSAVPDMDETTKAEVLQIPKKLGILSRPVFQISTDSGQEGKLFSLPQKEGGTAPCQLKPLNVVAEQSTKQLLNVVRCAQTSQLYALVNGALRPIFPLGTTLAPCDPSMGLTSTSTKPKNSLANTVQSKMTTNLAYMTNPSQRVLSKGKTLGLSEKLPTSEVVTKNDANQSQARQNPLNVPIGNAKDVENANPLSIHTAEAKVPIKSKDELQVLPCNGICNIQMKPTNDAHPASCGGELLLSSNTGKESKYARRDTKQKRTAEGIINPKSQIHEVEKHKHEMRLCPILDQENSFSDAKNNSEVIRIDAKKKTVPCATLADSVVDLTVKTIEAKEKKHVENVSKESCNVFIKKMENVGHSLPNDAQAILSVEKIVDLTVDKKDDEGNVTVDSVKNKIDPASSRCQTKHVRDFNKQVTKDNLTLTTKAELYHAHHDGTVEIQQSREAQKKLIKTKFIILKAMLSPSALFSQGDVCDRWMAVKSRTGLNGMTDPNFIEYLLWLEETRQQTMKNKGNCCFCLNKAAKHKNPQMDQKIYSEGIKVPETAKSLPKKKVVAVAQKNASSKKETVKKQAIENAIEHILDQSRSLQHPNSIVTGSEPSGSKSPPSTQFYQFLYVPSLITASSNITDQNNNTMPIAKVKTESPKVVEVSPLKPKDAFSPSQQKVDLLHSRSEQEQDRSTTSNISNSSPLSCMSSPIDRLGISPASCSDRTSLCSNVDVVWCSPASTSFQSETTLSVASSPHLLKEVKQEIEDFSLEETMPIKASTSASDLCETTFSYHKMQHSRGQTKKRSSENVLADLPEAKRQKLSCMSSHCQKQMKWALGVLTDWLVEHSMFNVPLLDMNAEWFDQILADFYISARNSSDKQYSVDRLQTFRRTLSLYLALCSNKNVVNVSIAVDPEFIRSNQVLAELTNSLKGPVPPVCMQITNKDMDWLYTTRTLSDVCPVTLSYKVWFDVTFHLARGKPTRSFWRNLTRSCLSLQSDRNGVYYAFVHNEHQPFVSKEKLGKMYATPADPEKCPVRTTALYLSKLDTQCDAFFQSPRKYVLPTDKWFLPIPVSQDRLGNMMATISKHAKLSCIYSNQSVIVTAQIMRHLQGKKE